MVHETAASRPLDLKADCRRCVALCCVAPAFSKSNDFAINKPAGRPCPNLDDDYGCGIHDRLRDQGFPGCTVFDCFGAGQRVTQQTFGGASWRDSPQTARSMFAVFATMRHLHELLWLIKAATELRTSASLRPELETAYADIVALTSGSASELVALQVEPIRTRTNELLNRASESARAGLGGRMMRGANLIGVSLRGARLRGASLRGAVLIGADLRGADLSVADLTGADTRGTDLRGTDLTGALFVTQAQMDAARGDASTRLPETLSRPIHWS